MLKIKDSVDLKELEKFGFHSYKLNRNQTNYYRCFAVGCKLMLLNNVLKEIVIDKWYDNDTRIHKTPKCLYKDRKTIEECLFDLIKADMVEKVEEL